MRLSSDAMVFAESHDLIWIETCGILCRVNYKRIGLIPPRNLQAAIRHEWKTSPNSCQPFCSRRLHLFRGMPHPPGVLARCWRLVYTSERLRSAPWAARECKATVRGVEKWCRRSQATGTVDDTRRAGMPRAPLVSREATMLLKEGIKRGDQCPQLAIMLLHTLGVIVSAETVRQHMNTYLAR